jgi:polar amino acid transport system ATP-binding protein
VTFPETYEECRARFRLAADRAGARLEDHAIAARGPAGERLTLDVARLGAERAERVLVVMSGTHGVEGFAGSAIQQALLEECALRGRLPSRAAIVVVHAVNPYGMAWWRRQNESNVDLNRNWIDFSGPLPRNDGYAELHAMLCPATADPASEQAFLEAARRLIAERGYPWVKRAVTTGQYEFPDGLYYGGSTREASTRILADVFARHVKGCAEALSVDLHTGHGEFGTCTLLSNAACASDEQAWLARTFGAARVEVTRDNPDATTPDKIGQLARGAAELLPGTAYRSITFELGTVDDLTMILAERREHWLHRLGDRAGPEGRAIALHHKRCSTPDSREWESLSLAHGRRVLADAQRGLFQS